MTTTSLKAVINGDFVRRFAPSANRSSSVSTGTITGSKSSSASTGDTTSLSEGLRAGARTYSEALTGLNTSFALLNESSETLEKLGKLVDKIIKVVDTASKESSGSATRGNLNAEFKKLAKEFRTIVKDAKIEETEFIREGDLSTVFQAAGLDKESSDNIAAAFDRFLLHPRDDYLASERTKGTRPLRLPVSVETTTDTTIGGGGQVTVGSPGGSFQAAISAAAGNDVTDIAISDLNGDGKTDVVSSNSGGRILVKVGNGNGTFSVGISLAQSSEGSFSPGVSFANVAVGQSMRPGAVGDFDNDGNLDYVGVISSTDAAALTLGNGNGTFKSPTAVFGAGDDPNNVIAVDLDADGKLDLVSASLTDNKINVLFGNGNGTFLARLSIATGLAFSVGQVRVGDVTGDGKLDIVGGGPNQVSIIAGLGSRTFGAAGTFTNGTTGTGSLGQSSLQLIDMDGDSDLDIVSAVTNTNVPTGLVGVSLNNGTGSFTAYYTLARPQGSALASVVASDWNGDGKTDLLVGGGSNSGAQNYQILNGNGNGTFTFGQTFALGSARLVVDGMSDINKDGFADIILAAGSSGGSDKGLGYILGNGNGTFGQIINVGSQGFDSTGSTGGLVGDFNKDGLNDLLTFDRNNESAHYYQASPVYGTPSDIQLIDVNGDGKSDTVATYSTGILTYLGNGNSTFAGPKAFAFSGFTPGQVTNSGDLDGDGKLDLVVTGGTGAAGQLVLKGNGNGTFQTSQAIAQNGASYEAGFDPVGSTLSDVNGDGKLDLITAGDTAKAYTLLGNGNGTFGAAISSPINASGGFSVAAANFDTDGKRDLVVAGLFNLTVYSGDGAGSFGSVVTLSTDTFDAVRVGDFNNDGIQDVAARGGFAGNVNLFIGNGNGTFGARLSFGQGISGSFPAGFGDFELGNFNGDTQLDIIATDPDNDAVQIFFGAGTQANVGAGSFETPVSYDAGSNPTQNRYGDYDGDGKTDLITLSTGDNKVRVFKGNGNGTFSSYLSFASGTTTPGGLDVGDFDGNGKLDVFVGDKGDNFSQIFLNGSTTGTFFGATTRGPVALVDFNGDGKLDVFHASGIGLGYQGGDGAGAPSGVGFTGNHAGADFVDVIGADLDGNGKLDLIGVDRAQNRVTVRYQDGAGVFGTVSHYTVGNSPTSVLAQDIDGDGKLDLVTTNSGDDSVSFLRNTGGGTFGAATSMFAGDDPTDAAFLDINLDGKLDLVTTSQGDDRINTFYGNGNGTFGPRLSYYGGDGPNSLSVVDVDGDGYTDLVTTSAVDGKLNVLRRAVTETETESGEGIKTPIEMEKIFDSARSILGRGDAILVATDARALKKQIEKNLKSLKNLRSVLEDNIGLVRTTGLALLELSNQVTGSESADQVASSIRNRILQSGKSYLTQLQNLDPITVKTLQKFNDDD